MNPHEELSAWMDGQAQAGRAEAMVKTVLQDPESRARWNDWHLIGDVMRSTALAQPTSVADAVSKALANEPIHLPVASASRVQPAGAPVRRRMPRAMAGGAVAAALAFVVFVAVAPQMQQADGPTQMAGSGAALQSPDSQPAAVAMSNVEVFRAASSAPPLRYKPESLKGFKVVGVYERHGQAGIEMRRYVLSDGVTAVSVLVQPKTAMAHSAQVDPRAGAVSMLSRDIDDIRFVVSGDIPPDALRQFVQTIEWKNAP